MIRIPLPRLTPAGRRKSSGPAQAGRAFDWRSPWASPAPRAPALPAGWPCPSLSLAELWAVHASRVRIILDGLPMSESDREGLAVPALAGFLSLVHCLPASPDHHGWPGGMAEYGLAAAAAALDAARARPAAEFETGRMRYQGSARAAVAAALAALAKPLGALPDLRAGDAAGRLWNCETSALLAWLEARKVPSFYAEWREDAGGPGGLARSVAALRLARRHVIGARLSSWLDMHPEAGIGQMLDLAVAGEGPLAEIVAGACRRASAEGVPGPNSAARPRPYSARARAVLLAMRQCLASGKWTFNRQGSQLFVTQWGTFVDASRIAEDIAERARANGSVAVPETGEEVAELLRSEGVAGGPAGEPPCLWELKLRGSPEVIRCFQVLVPEAFTPPGIGPVAFAEAEIARRDTECSADDPAVIAEMRARGGDPGAAQEGSLPKETQPPPASRPGTAPAGGDAAVSVDIAIFGEEKRYPSYRDRREDQKSNAADSAFPGGEAERRAFLEGLLHDLRSQMISGSGGLLMHSGTKGARCNSLKKKDGRLICSGQQLKRELAKKGVELSEFISLLPEGLSWSPVSGLFILLDRGNAAGGPAPGRADGEGGTLPAVIGTDESYRATAASLARQMREGRGRWLEAAERDGGRRSTLARDPDGRLSCSSLTLEALFARKGVDIAPLARFFPEGTFEYDGHEHVFRLDPGGAAPAPREAP